MFQGTRVRYFMISCWELWSWIARCSFTYDQVGNPMNADWGEMFIPGMNADFPIYIFFVIPLAHWLLPLSLDAKLVCPCLSHSLFIFSPRFFLPWAHACVKDFNCIDGRVHLATPISERAQMWEVAIQSSGRLFFTGIFMHTQWCDLTYSDGIAMESLWQRSCEWNVHQIRQVWSHIRVPSSDQVE